MLTRLAGALILTPWIGQVWGAEFCVQDSAGLNAALTGAGSNGENDIIKIAPGTYTPTANSTFVLNVTDNAAIVMGGGFDTPLGGQPCSMQLRGANHTIFDGVQSNRLLSIAVAGAGSAPVTLFNFTVKGGVSTGASSILGVFGQSWSGNINVAGLSIRDNAAASKVIRLQTQGSVVVRNSEFVSNSAEESVVALTATGTLAPTDGIVFNNNTIADNNSPAAAAFNTGSSRDIRISNSIIQSNVGSDILASGANTFFDHSDIGTRDIAGNFSESNAVNVAPGFVGTGDFRLAYTSVLIDSGLNAAIGGVGEFDADGQARVSNGVVDIGAYESVGLDVIFEDGFED